MEAELNEYFGRDAALPPEVVTELGSILRLHDTSPQELFYKWESYSIKMGQEGRTVDLKTLRDFKKDLHELLERDMRAKGSARASERKIVGATPRAPRGSGDMFGMMEGVVDTPRMPMAGVNGNSQKRRSNFETPLAKTTKTHANSSPGDSRTPLASVGQSVAFSQRQNAGQIIESLNSHLELPETSTAGPSEPRVKAKLNTEDKKFSYKSMVMKLGEASETLDNRIDGFIEAVQRHHGLDLDAFGNAASQSPHEIVAIGRIASDNGEGKLSSGSIVLEASRRTGAGLRTPLKLDALSGYAFFPGQIVALRGTNPSGEYFNVSEILDLPFLPSFASDIAVLDAFDAKLGDKESGDSRPLNCLISSGPYTADDNLDFEPLRAICEKASTTFADALILTGPFLDVEHPQVASGNFPPFPTSMNINPDTATLADVFRSCVSLPLQHLVHSHPTITVIMVTSTRDAINKHVSWPQNKLFKKELNLPRQVNMLPDPVVVSLNECAFGISSQDILYELRREECTGGNLPSESQNLLARLSRHIIEQRHFFPLFPPTARNHLPKPTAVEGISEQDMENKAIGALLDISYLELGAFPDVKPDILITPSALAPFAKVTEGVIVVNPGTLSKRKGPGTFAQMMIKPRNVADGERAISGEGAVLHKLYDRSRVDIVRI